LRGKATSFAIKIKELKARVLPTLDDDFAKDLGEFETLEDVKKAVTGDLEKRLTEQAENAVAEAIVAELVKANPIEVPRSLVQQQNAITEQELVQQARARGQRGGLNAELRQRIAADSEVKVRAGLLMAEIAKRENIKIGDKEIEEGLAELAAQSGKNVAKLRVEYREPKKREMLIGMILENKVLDIIESKSKITEATE
jgi:trigger factor